MANKTSAALDKSILAVARWAYEASSGDLFAAIDPDERAALECLINDWDIASDDYTTAAFEDGRILRPLP